MLAIPIDDASTCHLASCLGASLEAGYKMYPYLQGLYKPDDASTFHSPMYEQSTHTCPNKHGMVRIKERASSLKHILATKVEYYNMASVNSDPQERHCVTHEDDYACVTGKNTRKIVKYYSFHETPLLKSFSHSTLHHHTW